MGFSRSFSIYTQVNVIVEVVMPYDYNEKLTVNSQSLRRNMTPEEKHLWYDFLKLLPVTVNRQKMIGDYIADFYIHSGKIVIEVDGIQHHLSDHKDKDKKRDSYMSELGITVLRYDNESIKNRFDFVCEDILNHLGLDFSSIKRRRF